MAPFSALHSDGAKAMDYMLMRWDSFTRFLVDGRVCLTNNATDENCAVSRRCVPWRRQLARVIMLRRVVLLHGRLPVTIAPRATRIERKELGEMFQDQRIVWGIVVIVIIGLGVIGYAGGWFGGETLPTPPTK
jgi:Transposase IS66 family